jgi:hypothetical protein
MHSSIRGCLVWQNKLLVILVYYLYGLSYIRDKQFGTFGLKEWLEKVQVIDVHN